jgi:hypothetical protein
MNHLTLHLRDFQETSYGLSPARLACGHPLIWTQQGRGWRRLCLQAGRRCRNSSRAKRDQVRFDAIGSPDAHLCRRGSRMRGIWVITTSVCWCLPLFHSLRFMRILRIVFFSRLLAANDAAQVTQVPQPAGNTGSC